ncbi:FtsK/SpoIIIE family DNA translocase [Rubeoparvulum massiliense]|uniref:FtsK/SpoIIIE family DNA translocase n=1 Tax=Rubeoparvulum massiliense TaxID=1631346 RepID=UPI00065E50B9|nr:DNA translocase FtsK [Rubeoparvulum massiliense]
MKKNVRRSRKKAQQKGLDTLKYEIYGLLMLLIAMITLAHSGSVGQSLAFFSRMLVGNWDFIPSILLIILAVYVMVKRHWPQRWSMRWTGALFIILSILLYNHHIFIQTIFAEFGELPILHITWDQVWRQAMLAEPIEVGGGLIGGVCYAGLTYLLGTAGTVIFMLFLLISGFLLFTGRSFVDLLRRIKARLSKTNKLVLSRLNQAVSLVNERSSTGDQSLPTSHEEEKNISPHEGEKKSEPVIHDFMQMTSSNNEHDGMEIVSEPGSSQLKVRFPVQEPAAPVNTPIKENHDPSSNNWKGEDGELPFPHEEPVNESYQLPLLSLLQTRSTNQDSAYHKVMQRNAKKLESTLDSFGVRAHVTQIHRGPAVTRYEVQPELGVKVSRIVSLTDDIALALAAKDIRIEAPIPGKAALGIEVPNEEIAIVGLREVLESPVFQESTSRLSIALGRDISGEPVVGNLTKMPHLLVAGATGSGKSVCINGIISSLLYKAKPNEVKLILVDPKMVELTVYNGIPHLLSPVVTDPRQAAMVLKKVVKEMEQRYELFARTGIRDIDRYNEWVTQHEEGSPLPYIVVIVDELADLMMVAPGDVEEAITRLAQMARAAGIHLILATQRPSVDVITGVIKANIPSRIAFGVSSQTDSRTILDMGGAEKLLGRGDMLYLPVGKSKPTRIQGAFISDDEVEALVSHVKAQQDVHYREDLLVTPGEEMVEFEVEDELYEQARSIVIEAQSASVSMLQRRLRIGYTRAARLMDSLEAQNVVGPYEGSKPREVLVPRPDQNQIHSM